MGMWNYWLQYIVHMVSEECCSLNCLVMLVYKNKWVFFIANHRVDKNKNKLAVPTSVCAMWKMLFSEV